MPLSNGTPTTATSHRLTSVRQGSSANVGGPAKRGVRLPSMGPRTGSPAPFPGPVRPAPFPPDASLAVARRGAQWALDRAAEAGRDVVSYGDDRTERWLTSDSADLRALVAQVLGAVIDYDAAHAGELVSSVRVWLEHDRQTERAARALHIHPNTLLYRVRRFEQVSGCSLGSTESLAEVWLALRATAAVPDVAHRPSAGLGFHDS